MREPDPIVARRLDDGTVVQVLPDGTTRPMEDGTDWARIDAIVEEEIEANDRSDPDNAPITAAELARMHRVPNAKAIRHGLGMTQEQCSHRFRLWFDAAPDPAEADAVGARPSCSGIGQASRPRRTAMSLCQAEPPCTPCICPYPPWGSAR